MEFLVNRKLSDKSDALLILTSNFFQVHFAAQHSNKKQCYRCKRCNACFFNDLDFEKHIFKEHLQLIRQTNSPQQKQPLPSPTFAGLHEMLKRGSPFHQLTSPDDKNLAQNRLKCMFCGKICDSEEHLQTHIYSHMKQFNCLYCDKVFHLSSLLEQHIKAFHMHELLGSSQSEQIQKISPNLVTSRANSFDFGSAIDLYSSAQSPVESLMFKFSSAKTSPGRIAGVATATARCGMCQASFVSELELMKHKWTHVFTLSTPRCTLCNAVFSSPSNLAAHMFEHKVIEFFPVFGTFFSTIY